MWNDIDDASTCEFCNWFKVDYDRDGAEDDGPWFSCEDGEDYLAWKCGTPWLDKAIIMDWMRFWWDMATDLHESGYSYTVSQMIDVWDTANPRNWPGAYGMAVYESLRWAAAQEDIDLDDWDDEADDNGVDR